MTDTFSTPAVTSQRNAKLVSICMPVFNGEDLIGKTLEMLIEQDYPNLEIIIRDDASSDRTPTILQEFARRDPRIRVERNPFNVGMWKNLVDAFDGARGEYWMIAAHDDVFAPTLVSALVAELEANPAAVMSFCHLGIVDYEGNLVDRKYDDLPRSFHSLGQERMYRLYLDPEFRIDGTLNSSMFRSEALRKAFEYIRSQRKVAGGIDAIIPLLCLQMGDLVIRPERLFYRRLKKQNLNRSEIRVWSANLPAALFQGTKSALSYQLNYWYHVRRCFPLRHLTAYARLWIEFRLFVIFVRKLRSLILHLVGENLRRANQA